MDCRLAVARTAAVLCAAILAAALPPAHAFDIYLDHNTDGDPDTFDNYVANLVSVPVDLIVNFTPASRCRFMNWRASVTSMSSVP